MSTDANRCAYTSDERVRGAATLRSRAQESGAAAVVARIPTASTPRQRATGPTTPRRASQADSDTLPSAPDRQALGRHLLATVILGVGFVALVLAVPGLRPVTRDVAVMDPAKVLIAVGLEVASCLSFVVIFRGFFDTLPAAPARRLAWTQMGSGALLPGGGVGSLAVGGWLLHLAGMPTSQILRRSSGLFFLTSAVNVFALAAAGGLLLLGVAHGPNDALLASVPVAAGLGAVVFVLSLPRLTHRLAARHPRLSWAHDVGTGIPDARHLLTHPTWRLMGALGYLLFDIAVLGATFAAAGLAAPVAPLVLAYILGYLANTVPVPGGIGLLDAGLVGALTLYGLPVTQAAAAVLVYHAIAFWIPALGGLAGYVLLRRGMAPEAVSVSS